MPRNVDTRSLGADVRVVSELGTTEPTTLAEAKNYLRIDNVADDALITSMITNARRRAEKYLNSDIISKEREVYYPVLNCEVNLYYSPISTITEVEVDGVVQTIDEGYETLGLDNPLVRILSSGSEKVKISYTTAGRDNDEIKLGVLALIAENYYGRTDKVNTNWKLWLSPFKVYGFYNVR